ncbi:MAG: helix-turn-helix domain-containing protein, partial [Acidimicrobiales bacterium]
MSRCRDFSYAEQHGGGGARTVTTRKKWTLPLHEVRAALALALKDGYSQREIAVAVGISHQSVGRYLRRINDASISLSDVLALDDDALEELLERGTPGPSEESFAPIDLVWVDRELNSQHPPTRTVLWDEYKRDHPDEQCYSYSQFNAEIRRYRKESRLTMHIDHTPGDRCYID